MKLPKTTKTVEHEERVLRWHNITEVAPTYANVLRAYPRLFDKFLDAKPKAEYFRKNDRLKGWYQIFILNVQTLKVVVHRDPKAEHRVWPCRACDHSSFQKAGSDSKGFHFCALHPEDRSTKVSWLKYCQKGGEA